MAEFKYEAKRRSGDAVNGTVTADNIEQAKQKLKDQGLTVQSVKKQSLNIDLNISLGGKATTKDLKTFTRQFATMIDAGLPLVQCLDILGSQSENKWFGEKLLEIKVHVEGGLTFSESLAKYPRIFDELFVALIAAGELGDLHGRSSCRECSLRCLTHIGRLRPYCITVHSSPSRSPEDQSFALR